MACDDDDGMYSPQHSQTTAPSPPSLYGRNPIDVCVRTVRDMPTLWAFPSCCTFKLLTIGFYLTFLGYHPHDTESPVKLLVLYSSKKRPATRVRFNGLTALASLFHYQSTNHRRPILVQTFAIGSDTCTRSPLQTNTRPGSQNRRRFSAPF